MKKIAPFLLSFILFSCGGNSETADLNVDTTSSEEIKPAVELTWDEILTDSNEVGTDLIIEGYLGDIGTYVDMTYGSMTLHLFERRNQKAGNQINLSVDIGSTPNRVKELPEKFTPEDFQVVCDDSSIVTTGAKLRIHAIKSESYSETIYLNVYKIEKVEDDFNAEIFTEAVKLTDEMMADTSLKNVYCFIEGKLDIPMIIFSYTTSMMLDLKNASVKDISMMDVRIGNGPSTMDELPDNYREKDLTVRDYTGEVIKYGSKLRFYGTWERYDFETTTPGLFYLEEIEVIK